MREVVILALGWISLVMGLVTFAVMLIYNVQMFVDLETFNPSGYIKVLGIFCVCLTTNIICNMYNE